MHQEAPHRDTFKQSWLQRTGARLLAASTLTLSFACLAPGRCVAQETVAPTAESSPAATSSVANLLETTQGQASDALEFALSHIGIRYKFGGNTPDSGFDCSGFVRWVFNRTWGVLLPRTSMDIAALGKPVDKEDLKPGDLVFFNTMRQAFSHVGIYLGDGQFLHAPSRGSQVRVENLDLSYWKKRFNGARRMDPEAMPLPSENR
jgi:cell wall-associated NlpC family hydrolase